MQHAGVAISTYMDQDTNVPSGLFYVRRDGTVRYGRGQTDGQFQCRICDAKTQYSFPWDWYARARAQAQAGKKGQAGRQAQTGTRPNAWRVSPLPAPSPWEELF